MKKYLFVFIALITASFASQSFPLALPGGGGIVFPTPPQKIHNFFGPDETKMGYDIFVSQSNDIIFFVMAAQFPRKIDAEREKCCLEGFLKGFLQKKENVLQNAKVINLRGKKALAFSVKNDTRFFIGRALVVEDYMYLLAVEAENENYRKDQFDSFVKSFTLQGAK